MLDNDFILSLQALLLWNQADLLTLTQELHSHEWTSDLALFLGYFMESPFLSFFCSRKPEISRWADSRGWYETAEEWSNVSYWKKIQTAKAWKAQTCKMAKNSWASDSTGMSVTAPFYKTLNPICWAETKKEHGAARRHARKKENICMHSTIQSWLTDAFCSIDSSGI